MIMQRFLILPILPILLVLPFAAQAQPASEVGLYLQPFATGKPFATIPLTELRDKEVQALVVDDVVSDEWFWFEQLGSYSGYVATSRVKKNLTVQPDTIVYRTKDMDGPILATAFDPKAVEVMNQEGLWVSVRYTGKAPLYFKRKGFTTDASTPSPTTTAVTPDTQMPPPDPAPFSKFPPGLVQEDGSEVPSQADTPNVQYFTLDGEPIDPDTIHIPDSHSPSTADDAYSPTLDTPLIIEPLDYTADESPQYVESPPNQATALKTRNFEGRLKRNKGLDLLFSRTPKYPYILEGLDGKDLAYIDTSELIQATALETYLKQVIVVHGSAEKTQESPPLIIYARYIQPK